MSEGTPAMTGTTCAHRVASVTEEISGIDGVTGVAVDLPTAGAVTVTGDRPVGFASPSRRPATTTPAEAGTSTRM